jgi:hypothetical protein
MSMPPASRNHGVGGVLALRIALTLIFLWKSCQLAHPWCGKGRKFANQGWRGSRSLRSRDAAIRAEQATAESANREVILQDGRNAPRDAQGRLLCRPQIAVETLPTCGRPSE